MQLKNETRNQNSVILKRQITSISIIQALIGTLINIDKVLKFLITHKQYMIFIKKMIKMQ
jgi:hypothetical protein